MVRHDTTSSSAFAHCMMRMVSEEKDSILTGLLVAALVFTAVKRSYHGKFVVCVLKAVARHTRRPGRTREFGREGPRAVFG